MSEHLIEIKFKIERFDNHPIGVICSVYYEGEYDPKYLCLSVNGKSKCRAGDMFQKEKGRKLALKRAIQCFPRSIRTVIWEAYFQRRFSTKSA